MMSGMMSSGVVGGGMQQAPPQQQQHQHLPQVNSNNSAPINRSLRESRINNSTSSIVSQQAETRTLRSPTPQSLQAREEDLEIRGFIARRSTRLTICLTCLLASLSCLTPFVSLHLTQRVGLLLFESDLLQFRSSIVSVIICLIVLVILHLVTLFWLDQKQHGSTQQQLMQVKGSTRKSWIMQRTYKQLIAIFALASAFSYLALVLIVPQIRQVQRMPLATFDCNANLITIENCHQQFTAKGGELSLGDAVRQLLLDKLDSSGRNGERLIKKLNCLKYNDKELKTLQVPTRFLLHKCGLVCKPQRQQLHQFSDDLNKEQQSHWSEAPKNVPMRDDHKRHPSKLLIPPYNAGLDSSGNIESRNFAYNNNPPNLPTTNPENSQVTTTTTKTPVPEESNASDNKQVSLKVCFSGEFSGGSNYKQFCVTNLANPRGRENTLTVGQLNAMLRRYISDPSNSDTNQEQYFNNNKNNNIDDPHVANDIEHPHRRSPNYQTHNKDDQNTHYMNPVVQFESHFKNWPHLLLEDNESDSTNSEADWCSFRPIPPFIVNNKPFSDIQCSLEHEYTLTTGPPVSLIDPSGGGNEKIYLKKARLDETQDANSFARERCNIQCKVNILYQILMSNSKKPSKRSEAANKKGRKTADQDYDYDEEEAETLGGKTVDGLHLYLPLKPCVLLTGDGDKSKTMNYYLIFRSIADGSIILVFILLDLFLLFESIDTKQFQLEVRKMRIIAPLVAIALVPLVVALLFDLIPYWYPTYYSSNLNSKSRREGYLTTLLNERVIPTILEFFAATSATSNSTIKKSKSSNSQIANLVSNSLSTESLLDKKSSFTSSLIIDNFMLPFFIHSIFMFVLAVNSLTLPLFTSSAPLMRVSSTEELGLSPKLGKPIKKLPSKARTRTKSSSWTSRSDALDQPVKKVKRDENQKDNSNQEEHQAKNHGQRKLLKDVMIKQISLHLIALFMGTQFNLSQLTQTQIIIESFGNPGLTNGAGYVALWFTLITQSGAIIFILLAAVLFIDEISTFLSNFSPFKTSVTTIITSGSERTQRCKAKLIHYLTISLFIYSTRYFAISNLISEFRFKWLVIFLFQAAELFNFPLTWFVITALGHEIATEYRVKNDYFRWKQYEQQNQLDNQSFLNQKQKDNFKQAPAGGNRGLDYHLVIQSSLGFVYFAVARSVALFAHTLNASLHLHSDNVDWFITSFYRPFTSPSTLAKGSTVGNHTTSSRASTSGAQASNADFLGEPPEALFSPLPGERQTYLHASRLFLKYNSLLCFILGIILLVALIYIKYQIWAENKRTLEVSKQLSGSRSSRLNEDKDHLDEQLSLDLMKIHQQSGSTKTIYPEPTHRRSSENISGSESNLARRSDSPRAKILFHYNLARARDSSDSSTSSVMAKSGRTRQSERSRRRPSQRSSFHNSSQRQVSQQQQEQRAQREGDLIIPIAILEECEQDEPLRSEDEEEQYSEREVRAPEDAQEGFVERVVSRKSKKVRIFEDRESWPGHQENTFAEDTRGDGVQLDDVVVQNQQSEPAPATDSKTTSYSSRKRQIIESKEETVRHKKSSENFLAADAKGLRTSLPQNRKRSISFAPIATLIGADGFSNQQQSRAFNQEARTNSSTSSSTIRYASPEPSIEEFDDSGDSIE